MKLLTVGIIGARSEAVKNAVYQALAANGVGDGGADVIRDSNGKVIKVLVNLPDQAADAAVIALSNTPGVSDISSGEPLPPGEKIVSEWTGGSLLEDAGWTLSYGAGVTLEQDGSIQIVRGGTYRVSQEHILGVKGVMNIMKFRAQMFSTLPHGGAGGNIRMVFGGVQSFRYFGVQNNILGISNEAGSSIASVPINMSVPHDFEVQTNGVDTLTILMDGNVVSDTASFYEGYAAKINSVTPQFGASSGWYNDTGTSYFKLYSLLIAQQR